MNPKDPNQPGRTPPPAQKPTPVKPVQVTPVPVKPVQVTPVPVNPAQAQPVTPVPVTPVPAQPVTPVPVTPVPAQPAVPAKADSRTAAKPVSPKAVVPLPAQPVTPAPRHPNPAAPQPVTPVPAQPVAPTPISPVPVSPQNTSAAPQPVAARPIAAKPVSSRPIPIKPPTEDDELAMLGTEAEEPNEEDEEAEADVERLKKSAPPWLVSTIVHVVVILIAGLWASASGRKPPVEFEATFAEVEGEQLDDALEFTEEDIQLEDDAFLEEVVVDPVLDPLSAPLDMVTDLNPVGMSPSFTAPTVGAALNGRTPGMKSGLLKAYGGTATTEKAVANGLAWLKENINDKTGGWSLSGPYSDGATAENQVAATAMAVLAFQGAGHTTKEGEYRKELSRAWNFLLSRQGKQGQFQMDKETPYNHAFYTHGQVTIALCELYALTGDKKLKRPAQNAIDYLLSAQANDGGWRYAPKDAGDLSVTGWAVMALQSARMGGLDVPEEALENIRKFLDSVSVEGKTKYKYRPNEGTGPTMTAEGLLCRQYLGWPHDEPALVIGTQYISENPIQWREPNHYYWYYATQLLHHMEGELWEDWNNVMRQEIPAHQVTEGRESGSWHDNNDQWGAYGGRLYTTCLSLYMLEVYYRHLPLYNSMYSK